MNKELEVLQNRITELTKVANLVPTGDSREDLERVTTEIKTQQGCAKSASDTAMALMVENKKMEQQIRHMRMQLIESKVQLQAAISRGDKGWAEAELHETELRHARLELLPQLLAIRVAAANLVDSMKTETFGDAMKDQKKYRQMKAWLDLSEILDAK